MKNEKSFTVTKKEWSSFLSFFNVVGLFTTAIVIFAINLSPFRPGLTCLFPLILLVIAFAIMGTYLKKEIVPKRNPENETAFERDERKKRKYL